MIVVGLRHERGLANAPHDAKLAFLKGELQDDIYVRHPAWFVLKGRADKELHLIKALYGLRQPLRAWYSKLAVSMEPRLKLSQALSLLLMLLSIGPLLVLCAIW